MFKQIDENSTSENLLKSVRKTKEGKKNQILLSKASNKLSRDKNKTQKNNTMFKLGTRSKRNSEEGWLN